MTKQKSEIIFKPAEIDPLDDITDMTPIKAPDKQNQDTPKSPTSNKSEDKASTT